MDAKHAIDTLRHHELALRARGVRHAALFGSVARGDNRPDSDLDILIEFDPDAHVTIFDYVGVKDFIAALFEEPVDVIDREALKRTCAARRLGTRSMPSEGDTSALRDILQNITLAQGFASGQDFISFRDDVMRVYATKRCLEIISEASRRLSDALKARHSDIPWRQMAAAGNIYRHD